jgi:hypothetical protein
MHTQKDACTQTHVHTGAHVFIHRLGEHTLTHTLQDTLQHAPTLGWPGSYICTVYDRIFGDFPAKNTVYVRVVQFDFWEQGFDKVRESSRTLKLFEQFDVQSQNWRILLVPMVILVQNILVLSYMYKMYHN